MVTACLSCLTTGVLLFRHKSCPTLCDPINCSTPGFPCGSAGKECTCNARDLGSISELGRSPGEGKGYPLQCSGLENSMQCIVHGVAKSQTRVSDFHFHFCMKCSLGISNFLEEKIQVFPISSLSLLLFSSISLH